VLRIKSRQEIPKAPKALNSRTTSSCIRGSELLQQILANKSKTERKNTELAREFNKRPKKISSPRRSAILRTELSRSNRDTTANQSKISMRQAPERRKAGPGHGAHGASATNPSPGCDPPGPTAATWRRAPPGAPSWR
jgi:hypothetical protein